VKQSVRPEIQTDDPLPGVTPISASALRRLQFFGVLLPMQIATSARRFGRTHLAGMTFQPIRGSLNEQGELDKIRTV
jgi:hypothetical protein